MCEYTDALESYKKEAEKRRIKVCVLTSEIKDIFAKYTNKAIDEIKLKTLTDLPMNKKVKISKNIYLKKKNDLLYHAYWKQGSIIEKHFHSEFSEQFFDIKGKLYNIVKKEFVEENWIAHNNEVHGFSAITDITLKMRIIL